jgi:NADH-quinone oxidoreductase subunit L
VAVLLGAIGIALGVSIYRRGLTEGRDPAIERLGALGRFFDRGWGIDPAVSYFVDKPGRAAAEVLAQPVDQGLIDGAGVNGSAYLARFVGWVGSQFQSGQLGTYAWVLVVGVIAVLGAFTL